MLTKVVMLPVTVMYLKLSTVGRTVFTIRRHVRVHLLRDLQPFVLIWEERA
jgi:hypothetical protein